MYLRSQKGCIITWLFDHPWRSSATALETVNYHASTLHAIRFHGIHHQYFLCRNLEELTKVQCWSMSRVLELLDACLELAAPCFHDYSTILSIDILDLTMFQWSPSEVQSILWVSAFNLQVLYVTYTIDIHQSFSNESREQTFYGVLSPFESCTFTVVGASCLDMRWRCWPQ